ncbi:MAG: RICIN domain-containing protein, partial [Coriobacteriales bacterium]|nr:RICIN domain-containing protein [Coriobacteriales bacterium]
MKALTDPAPGNVVASGYYTMASSLGSSLVMDVDGASTANDAKVVSYTRNWTAAQLFQLVYNSSDGCYTVKNPHSSKVLDIPGNRAVEGQK